MESKKLKSNILSDVDDDNGHRNQTNEEMVEELQRLRAENQALQATVSNLTLANNSLCGAASSMATAAAFRHHPTNLLQRLQTRIFEKELERRKADREAGTLKQKLSRATKALSETERELNQNLRSRGNTETELTKSIADGERLRKEITSKNSRIDALRDQVTKLKAQWSTEVKKTLKLRRELMAECN